MSKNTLLAGTAPFAHLLGRVLGKKPDGKKAEDGDLAPDDDDVVDQGEVDDALDDANVDDVEDGDEPEKMPEGKKKAKGKGAKAEDDEEGDDAEAAEPADEKEAKAFRRGMALGSVRENKRCAAIFSAAAAGARPDIAAQLAFSTRQSAAEAIGVLNAAATPLGRGGLDGRMAGRDDPKPGAGADASSGGQLTLAQRILATKKKIGAA